MAVPARIGLGSGRADTAGRADGIELRGLAKSYRSGDTVIPAVRGVDVSIALGETVAFLGPNGAGKSTTIDMLLGLAEPDAGTVSVFGQDPSAVVRAGQVGAMLQTGSLLRDLTVRELVAMMASLFPRPLDVDEVLELTGIAGVAGQPTQKLSGGQTQRVRFALALVPDPELLVLDEPTVGMDVEGRHAFWTTMRDFAARGRTVLFATHYLEEADAYADRIVLMARGSIVADGPPDRDQGDGRLAHDPGDAAPRRRRGARAAAGRDAGGAPRRVGHPRLLRLGSRDQGAARALPGRARPRDHGRRARGGVPAADRRRARRAA